MHTLVRLKQDIYWHNFVTRSI